MKQSPNVTAQLVAVDPFSLQATKDSYAQVGPGKLLYDLSGLIKISGPFLKICLLRGSLSLESPDQKVSNNGTVNYNPELVLASFTAGPDSLR